MNCGAQWPTKYICLKSLSDLVLPLPEDGSRYGFRNAVFYQKVDNWQSPRKSRYYSDWTIIAGNNDWVFYPDT